MAGGSARPVPRLGGCRPPPGSTALAWLLGRIASLPLGPRDQADLYESLDLLLLWRIRPRASRTQMRLPVRKPYFHAEPLLRRADIDLALELAAPPLPVAELSPPQARKILDLILDTSAMRYRELYGFTHPDTRRVFRADAGRGVEIVFFGIPPRWRLPLRTYHAGMFFKNGVPAGYVEVLSLFERAEIGFNLYYTFREGESAWLYARLLRLFRQILRARCFSVDPYQIGLENDEALDSGAFWFYRKLGFRPLDPAAAQSRRSRRKPHAPHARLSQFAPHPGKTGPLLHALRMRRCRSRRMGPFPPAKPPAEMRQEWRPADVAPRQVAGGVDRIGQQLAARG